MRKISLLLAAGAGLSFAHTASADDCDRVAAQLKQDRRTEILDKLSSKGMIVAAHRFGGGMTILCGDESGTRTDLAVGVNSSSPSKEFLSFFADLARRVVGAEPNEVLEAALRCRKNALGYKGNASGIFGDAVDTERLHIDCRVDDKFTSFGVFSKSPQQAP